jgi:hypothetical protein
MTGLTSWQRVVYYNGMVLMLGGFGWAVYRMFVVHGCPTASFNDLSLIILGLGVSVLPLHPFGAAPDYLVPLLRRNRGLAGVVWALALAGCGFGIIALWRHIPNAQWMAALIPAAYYMWFGIEAGKPGASSVVRAAASADADQAKSAETATPEVATGPVGRASVLPLDGSTDVTGREEINGQGRPFSGTPAPPEADRAVGPTENQERDDA